MLPSMNPKQMAKLMSQMGIKNTEVPAVRVVIEKEGGSRLVVTEPSVMLVEMQGQKSFQVSGNVSEEEAGAAGDSGEGSEAHAKKEAASEPSDAEVVMQQTNASREDAERALKESNGDIAEAIMLLESRR